MGAENQIPSIFVKIPEYSRVLMDFLWVQKSFSEKSLCAAAPNAPTVPTLMLPLDDYYE